MSISSLYSKSAWIISSIALFIASELFCLAMLIDGHMQKYTYRIPHSLNEARFNAVVDQIDKDTLTRIVRQSDIASVISNYNDTDFKDPGESFQDNILMSIAATHLVDENEYFNEVRELFENDIRHSFGYSPDYTMKYVKNDNGNVSTICTYSKESKFCPFRTRHFSSSLDSDHSLELDICICGMIFHDIMKMMIPFLVMDLCLIGILILLILQSKKENRRVWVTDKFASMAIHDLKNSLSIAFSANELLSSDETIKKNSYFTSLSGIVGKHISDINLEIERILGILRSGSKSVMTDIKIIDLREFISNLTDEYAEGHPQAQFINDVPSLTLIETDPKFLKYSIANIISNGLKYSESNPVMIFSSSYIRSKKVRLVMKDNGIGINKSDLNNIFKFGYRSNASKGGFGIGLYSILFLSESMGWNVKIASKEGDGTSISLDFKVKNRNIQ